MPGMAKHSPWRLGCFLPLSHPGRRAGGRDDKRTARFHGPDRL